MTNTTSQIDPREFDALKNTVDRLVVANSELTALISRIVGLHETMFPVVARLVQEAK